MLHEDRTELLNGRLAMRDDEIQEFAAMCREPGDHIEVGTLWGGSAIIAAQNKPRPGRLFTVDIMARGYWVDGDPAAPGKIAPTARAILSNFAHAGVADRITTICANSQPLPIVDVWPSTAYIDAGHGIVAIAHDWRNLSEITTHAIAIHDVRSDAPAVCSFVGDQVLTDPNWRQRSHTGTLLIMEHVA